MASVALPWLFEFPSTPEEDVETITLLGVQPDGAPKQVSRTNESSKPFVSPFTTFVELESKAINRSLALLIQGDPPFAVVPSTATETRVVFGMHPTAAPLQVSRKKTQAVLPHSPVPGNIFVALESKATKRPSPLTEES